MSGVTLSKVIKRYGETQVIHGVDLEVEDGEFCVFVGPSGCGKSTLLNCIAGLEPITGGTLAIGGKDMTHVSPKTATSPWCSSHTLCIRRCRSPRISPLA